MEWLHFDFYGTLLGAQLTDGPRLSKMARDIEVNFIQRELNEGLKEDYLMILGNNSFFFKLMNDKHQFFNDYEQYFLWWNLWKMIMSNIFYLVDYAYICPEPSRILLLPRGHSFKSVSRYSL